MYDQLEIPEHILSRAAKIRLLVLDVDGVLTDGTLAYDDNGVESKRFHVRDGYGIKAVQLVGITVAVISGRPSKATAKRLGELGVEHVFLDCDDKIGALSTLCIELELPMTDCACVGDDVPDTPMLDAAGLAIAVADAHPDCASRADWQTSMAGGRGAVREVCDMLITARGKA